MNLPNLNVPRAATIVLAALVAGQFVLSARSLIATGMAGRRVLGATAPRGAAEPHPSPILATRRIMQAHLFGEVSAPSDSADDPSAASPSQGGYVLKGVIHVPDRSQGLAIIARPDGHSALYRVGQSIDPNVLVRGVLSDAVLLFRDSKLERLALPRGTGIEGLTSRAQGAPPSSQTPPGAVTAETQMTLQAFGLSVLRDSNGAISGISGRGADMWRRSGLLPSDVIVSIDGRPVGAVLQEPAAIDRSAQAAVTTLSVLRDGREITLQAEPEPAQMPGRHPRHPPG